MMHWKISLIHFIKLMVSITRKYGGTGLGLTISQLLIKKEGNHQAIKSELAVGSCFTVTFPIHPAEVKIDNPTEKNKQN